MFDGISVVSGTYRQVHTVFGQEWCYEPKSRAVNLDVIASDIDRTPFFSQVPGDFEKFARLWINFDSSSFAQGDPMGGPLASVLGSLLMTGAEEIYPGKNTDIFQQCIKGHSSFGYLNDLGEVSGVNCYFIRDPNDPSFYYWFISIIHDATGSPDERTVHVVSNLPARPHAPIYLKEKCHELKPQEIMGHKELLVFLKSHLYSDHVYSLLEKSFNHDCTFKGEQQKRVADEVFTTETIKQAGFIRGKSNDSCIITPEAKTAQEKQGADYYGTENAKADAYKKLRELPKEEVQNNNNLPPANKEISVTGIAELRDSVYALHQYGLEVKKANPDSDEGQKIIDFSLNLNKQAKKIANSNTIQEFKAHKKTFDTALSKGKTELAWEQSILRTLLEKIFIAVSGLGMTMFVGELFDDNFREKFSLPFFRKKTLGEKLSDKTKSLTSKLSFKRKK